MEDLMQIKQSLKENKDKLISLKNSEASRVEGGIDDVNRLLKMLEVIEAKLYVAESTLQSSSGSLDKGLVERVKHMLFLLESFLEGDHMKGKAKMFEEESKVKPKNLLEKLFKLLKDEEVSVKLLMNLTMGICFFQRIYYLRFNLVAIKENFAQIKAKD
ncbi:uncharacterized protein LOC110723075 [Chenopodium quinoa]|uniref:uncharacterized protein LOC110723075 n=1 Tax=Chenopodium quinoa TaxID=63459 RepID=UPI000B78CC36|nr:uncharacterized protein LOC110723075 [Chenopodium quinoa]